MQVPPGSGAAQQQQSDYTRVRRRLRAPGILGRVGEEGQESLRLHAPR